MRRASLGCLLLVGAASCADKGDDDAVVQDNGNATASDAQVAPPQTDASAPNDAGMDAAQTLIDASLDAGGDAGDASVDPCIGKAARVGDVHVFNEYDLAEAQCFETIQGSLTIENSALWDLPFPKLREVSSDLAIVYTAQAGASTICDGASANRVRSATFPALTKVGRDLSLTIARNGQGGDASLRVDFGLPSLQTVGGDVDLSTNAGDLYGCGLDANELKGDVAFSFGKTDNVSGQLFAHTTNIGGTLSVHGGSTVATLFPALTQAAALELWDLTDQLGSVTGAVKLENLRVERAPKLNEVPVAAGTALMELRLIGTGVTTLLTDSNAPRFNLAPTGSVTLRGNSALPAPQLCGFISALSTAGWHGAADLDVTCP